MQLPLLLALRYLRSAAHEQTFSTMLKICFFSIMVGTGSLTLIASIMNGFEAATHKKLQGIHADLMIATQEGSIDYPRLSKLLKKRYTTAIVASSPSRTEHVMLHHGDETAICLMKAVDPTTEPQVSTLDEMIVESNGPAWKGLKGSTLFIGQSLAQRLQVTVGSTLKLLYQPKNSERLVKKKVKVAALFKSGIHDYDEQVIIAPFSLVNTLYPERVTHVALSLDPTVNPERLAHELQKTLSLDVYSWKDLYPPLVSALTLEKYAMWIILMLVTLVASLTIVALLYMYTTHKRTDIALLKSQGMTNFDLRLMFFWIASSISFCATTCGILVGATGVWLLNTYPFIPLPDVYYVSHLPATLDLSIVGGVYCLALLISVFAGFFPNNTIKTLNVAHILKGAQ